MCESFYNFYLGINEFIAVAIHYVTSRFVSLSSRSVVSNTKVHGPELDYSGLLNGPQGTGGREGREDCWGGGG